MAICEDEQFLITNFRQILSELGVQFLYKMQNLNRILQSKQLLVLIVGIAFNMFGCILLVWIVVNNWRVVQVREEVIPCASIQKTTDCSQLSSVLSENKYITVDIGGAVVVPGVYAISSQAKLADLVKMAGGLRNEYVDSMILQKTLNLAQSLENGQKYYVPYKGESYQLSASTAKNDTVQKSTDLSTGLVSINTADKKTLMSLKGIGDARAQAIIDHRPYSALTDLVNGGVITQTIYDNIEGSIAL